MNTTTIRSDWVGSVVDGRFKLLEWLGGTDRSGVFLTELEEHRTRKAAIKLIPANGVDADARLAGWAATKTLSHPHLMHLFRTGRCQIGGTDVLYAVMEHGEEVLSEVLRELPLTPLMATEMLDPLVDALSYLHAKGFVHGHVKPSNLMVVDDKLKLSCDSLQRAGRLTKRSQAPSVYDAPESATRPLTPAADVWSLGVTLVEALTQHPPVWDASADSDPAVPPSMPHPFADIAQGCLRRNPARRSSLSDIKARLAPDGPLPDEAGKSGKAGTAGLRVAALVAAALVVVVVVAVLFARSHKTGPSLPTAEQPVASAITAASPPSVPPSSPASSPAPSTAQAPSTDPSSSPTQTPAPATAVAPPPVQPPTPVPSTQSSRGTAIKGEVAERVMPVVPEKASATIQGVVSVKVRAAVDASGAVSNVALDSPGPSKYFANLALQAAQSWKFKPAQVDGQPVASEWLLRFQFRATGTDVTPVETSP